MQKKNRIFMRIVAALLVLVLFTTCLLSSVYARFVVKKSFSMNATFTQLGVEVGLNIEGNLLAALGGEEAVAAANYIKAEGDSMTITIPAGALKMAPGDDFSDDIHVSLSGTAGTRLRILIKNKITFGNNPSESDETKFMISDKTRYFPIGFYVTAKNADDKLEMVCVDIPVGTDETAAAVSTAINMDSTRPLGMDYICDSVQDYFNGNLDYGKEFAKGDNIVLHPKNSNGTPVETVDISEFYIGFRWPFDENDHKVMIGTVPDAHDMNSKYDTDVIGDSFTYSFTITVEQLPKTTEAA